MRGFELKMQRPTVQRRKATFRWARHVLPRAADSPMRPDQASDGAPLSQLAIGLKQTLTRLGRHPDSEISLDDITVSRRHAEVQHTEQGYAVADSGSLNGTYLNQQRVERAALSHGDELQIGKFRLVFFERADG